MTGMPWKRCWRYPQNGSSILPTWLFYSSLVEVGFWWELTGDTTFFTSTHLKISVHIFFPQMSFPPVFQSFSSQVHWFYSPWVSQYTITYLADFFSPKCMIIYITRSSAHCEGFLSTLPFRSVHLWACICVACRAISKLHLSVLFLSQLIGHIPWGLRYILASRRHFKRNKIHRPRRKLFQVTYLCCSGYIITCWSIAKSPVSTKAQ